MTVVPAEDGVVLAFSLEPSGVCGMLGAVEGVFISSTLGSISFPVFGSMI